MAFDDGAAQERTEQPTGKRREEARRQGRVAVSPDLTAAAVILGAFGVYAMAGERFVTGALGTFELRLGEVPRGDLTVQAALTLLSAGAAASLRLAWPFMAIPVAIAFTAQLVQTRFAFAPLRAQWSRLNPLQGFARLVGLRGVVELLKSILKLGLVGGIVYLTLREDWGLFFTLAPAGGGEALSTLARIIAEVWLRIGIAYLALAGADYGYQRWQHGRSLRMTKDEVRQESKDTEGSPLLRSRIRAVQKQLAGRRMMAQVGRADVVLRNPTHVAVALRYERGHMRAPKVVAKGERLLALRIIDVAARHGVPVVENPPLARTLFKVVAIGREIPQDLYRAVADVLAYVYALKGGGR